jgi:hypothetical protein
MAEPPVKRNSARDHSSEEPLVQHSSVHFTFLELKRLEVISHEFLEETK